MTTETKRFIQDEAGQWDSGLKFYMNGSKFRWDVFKMAYEMSHPKSLEQVFHVSQEIIDWVNNEQKIKFTSKTTENQQDANR